MSSHRTLRRSAEASRLHSGLWAGLAARWVAQECCLFFVVILPAVAANVPRTEIPVVVAAAQPSPVQLAAQDLAGYLGRIYPDVSFPLVEKSPASGSCIRIGSVAAEPDLAAHAAGRLAGPESFAVLTTQDGSREVGLVIGADALGAAHGAYALLERLGCGFYLSYEAVPPPRSGPMSFAGWEIADAPVCGDRIIFNWHNFLSSASTWNFEDWRQYIDAAARMGFNHLMVHAYGNNPIFSFTFNGVTKPVGFLSTTASGRDWGTVHVNDVRRLIGGEIFSGPVFGSEAALVAPEQRVAAATTLMQRVFAHARRRGFGVTFALDYDTPAANPPEVIATLPASATFSTGGYTLANPDTPEGYAYYKAQVAQLLGPYPEITRLVVWFRTSPGKNPTPWNALTRDTMPEAWRKEFTGPDAEARDFGWSRLVAATGCALRELGRGDVELAAGSWWRAGMPGRIDRYLPREVTLFALDAAISLANPRAQEALRAVKSGRKLIPIIWPQHDDYAYLGRSFTPVAGLASVLERCGAAGVGVQHWTTRPHDLYVKSASAQMWRSTRDQPLEKTADDMAARSFGDAARETGARYLLDWSKDAPMFGRETTDLFIDRPLPDPEATWRHVHERLALLDRIAAGGMSAGQSERVAFWRNYEQFILSFYASQTAFVHAKEALKQGDLDRARAEARNVTAERTVGDFVTAVRAGGISRGEEALVLSLDLRWLPFVQSLRQSLGLEPVRYNFGPTRHELLAQGAGKNTFFVDREHRLWQTLGAKETGATAVATPGAPEELARGHLESDRPLRLMFTPIVSTWTVDMSGNVATGTEAKVNDTLPPGEYRLTLLFADPDTTAPGRRVFTVEIGGEAVATARRERLDVFQLAGRRGKLVERSFDLTLTKAGRVEVTLTPEKGNALINGAVLEPLPARP